jgi:hypothetical protein
LHFQNTEMGQIATGPRKRSPNTSGVALRFVSSSAPFGATPSWHGQALPVVNLILDSSKARTTS